MKGAHSTTHKVIFLKPAELKKRSPDIGKLMSSLPAWALFAVIVNGFTLLIGLGIFIGYQRFSAGNQQPDAPLETALGAVLGLLAFMLAFAFSSTWTRFVRRNAYVVAHAKTIATCYLRSSLVPEKQKLEIRKLLYEYAGILLDIQITTHLERSLSRINDIHLLLWQETVTLIKEDIDSELRSLFTSSVNDLVNLAQERKTIALFIRIPNAIWAGLFLLAVISMLAFGYQAGIHGVSRVFQMPLLPVAFGLVMVLIADLNSQNGQRHFKVTRRPMKEVLDMMEKTYHYN